MKIAVLGGGIAGLAVSYKLVEKGYNVTLFEKEMHVGGLASYYEDGTPCTYHHAIPNDKPLLNLLNELKISVEWKKVKIGFYEAGKTYPFNGPLDLLRFKPLSFMDRIRFGHLLLRARKDKGDLTGVSVRDWTVKNAGINVYEKFIDPLVSSYYGSSDNISAQYLVSRWRNESVNAVGKLGYIELPKLLNALERKCSPYIVFSEAIRLKRNGNCFKIILKKFTELKTDAVVSTIPAPELAKIYPECNYVENLRKVKYKAVICLVYWLRYPANSYYWIIPLSEEPAISWLEYSHLSGAKGGLTYVVSYVDPCCDLRWRMSDEELNSLYLNWAKKVFDSFSIPLRWRIFRASYGNPIYVKGWEYLPVQLEENLYLAGMARIFPDIRCMGASIRTVNEVLEEL